MISDLHSRQFFAKRFTKTQKFGVLGRRRQGAPGAHRPSPAGDEKELISHPDRLRPGIPEPNDGDQGSTVTPVGPSSVHAQQVGASGRPARKGGEHSRGGRPGPVPPSGFRCLRRSPDGRGRSPRIARTSGSMQILIPRV